MRESDVVGYLVDHGLIDTASIVDGDLRVLDASRRNWNFRVVREHGPSYLVKIGSGRDPVAGPSREALAYEIVRTATGSGRIAAFLPRLVHQDPDEEILIVELYDASEDLRQYHHRLGRFPRWVASQLGAALAELHAIPVPTERPEPRHPLASPEPPGFYLHRPGLTVLDDFSAAASEIIHLVQQFPDIGSLLDDLRRTWRPSTFIHQDARWDNVLVVRSRPGRSEIKIVDWEAAGLGDPAWDVGALLGDYVGFWIGSIPINGQVPPDRYLQHATCPIGSMQPAIRAFWDAYRRTARLTPAAAEDFLLRVARYSGLKLLQTALEHVQDAPECTMTAICLLQVGVNMLLRPRDAAAVLFAVPVSDGVA